MVLSAFYYRYTTVFIVLCLAILSKGTFRTFELRRKKATVAQGFTSLSVKYKNHEEHSLGMSKKPADFVALEYFIVVQYTKHCCPLAKISSP